MAFIIPNLNVPLSLSEGANCKIKLGMESLAMLAAIRRATSAAPPAHLEFRRKISENAGKTNREGQVSSPLELLAQEIATHKPEIKDLIGTRDSGAQLLRVLSLNVAPADVATPAGGKVWELCGSYLFTSDRVHEALILFLRLYDLKLAAQATVGRIHKGSPLIWISFCFATLGFIVHAKRYAMLALCEDAVEGKGQVSPDEPPPSTPVGLSHALR